jgi:hypothetical protein
MARTIIIGTPQTLIPEKDSPPAEGAAEGYSALDSRQRSIVIGETVPIVFGKRVTRTTYKWNLDVSTAIVYEVGGVFVSPGATEGRFQNNGTTNELAVKLHLVLSQGDMPQLQVRDVFQRACRVGTWKQTYDQRAGTWTPGNFITAVAGKDLWACPAFCGTSGYYDDLTTLSYENSHADGDDTWDRQVHCFVRQGIIVDRLIEGTAGSSNNVCDLAIYLIKQSSRFPDALIDTATFTAAANFTETQQLYYNGIVEASQNLEDWLQSTSLYFLLRVNDKNGKKAFRPRLPYTGAYAIDTTAIEWVFGFTEDHVLPDGFEIEFIPYADRRPTAMQMLWRQQPDDDIGLIRTSVVRLPGTGADAPIEQHDLSEFCTSELHAAKVGAYLAARRIFITHTLRIRVRPDAFNSTLTLGDVVRVRLRRETDLDAVTYHDYLYEVERINKSLSGAVELDLIHYPIDANGRSIVALYVASTTINGFEYPTGRGDFTCDVNDPEDEDPIPDEGGDLPDLPEDLPDDIDPDPDGTEWPPTVPEPSVPAGNADPDDPDAEGGRDSSPTGVINNPADPIDSVDDENVGGGGTIGGIPTGRPLLPGDELTYTPPCCPAEVLMYAIDYDTGERLQEAPVAIGTAIVGDCEVRFEILSEYIFDTATAFEFTHRCVDPGSPDGYGAELPGGTVPLATGLQLDVPGEYRITLPDWSVSFSLNEEYQWYQIFVDKTSCGGDSWVRAVRYYTLDTEELVTQAWGGCASSYSLMPGQLYGSLYRRIPGTTGPGLINFDFIRTLIVP